MKADWKKYFDPETLRGLEGLRFSARQRFGGALSGGHRSPQQGQALEFAQHREYAPGDDVRQIDWKVFARTDKFYLKQHEDESNLSCHLLMDCSQSMDFRGRASAESKIEFAKRLAAAVAYIAFQGQDSVSLTTSGLGTNRLVAPTTGPASLQFVGEALCQIESAGEMSVEQSIRDFTDGRPRRGLVVLISDFLNELESISVGIRNLRSLGFDCLLLHVMDRDELDFPFSEPTKFLGLELVDDIEAEGAGIRAAYRAEVSAFCAGLLRSSQQQAFNYRLMVSDESATAALIELLST